MSRPSTKYWILENVRRLLEAFLSCSFPLFCESVTKVLECVVECVKACGFAKSGRIIKSNRWKSKVNGGACQTVSTHRVISQVP